MKVRTNGWEVEVLLPGYEPDEEALADLMANHVYNANVDWEKYRKTGDLWRRKKKRGSSD